MGGHFEKGETFEFEDVEYILKCDPCGPGELVQWVKPLA